RAVAGPDVALYADANQAWDVDEAVAMAPLLRAADVAWIEEPVRGNALAALEELHRRTGLTIATGENMYGRHEFRAFAASPAIGILQPDLAKTGGLTEVRAICAVARSEEHTSELQSRENLVCRLLLEKKKNVTSP